MYERVGGHAYGSVYPGPIGAILNPQIRGLTSDIDKSLPFASSLCGACAEACPMQIPIADMLVHMRHRVVEEKKRGRPGVEQALMKAGGWLMGDASRLATAGKLSATVGKLLPIRTIGPLPPPLSRWTDSRDVPMVPGETFRQWWAKNRTGQEDQR